MQIRTQFAWVVLGLSGLLLFVPPVEAAGPASPIIVSATGSQWGNTTFGLEEVADFTAEVDATPLAPLIDGGVGLSDGPQATFSGLACIARFNSSGFIDARNGGTYSAASSIHYSANVTYRFLFSVSMTNHTYSLYVSPIGQPLQTVALNYAFRTEQQSISLLNNWSAFADVGSMQVSSFLAASAIAPPNSLWINTGFGTQTSLFQVEWDAMPTAAGMDGVMALSNGAQSTFPGFACLVRFYTDGTIQVRNGGSYGADVTVSYSPQTMYHFRVLVNLSVGSYSVYVTPSGLTEQTIATNYAFRTEQAGIAAINNVGTIVDAGTGALRFGNFVVTRSAYDQVVLADGPIAFWRVDPLTGAEPDQTGNGNTGTYHAALPPILVLPNGDPAARFDGLTQFVSVQSNSAFSISTTGTLTWEMWINPTETTFPTATTDRYVHAMGRCQSHPNAGLCEWVARMYENTGSIQNRCDRLGAYAYNPNGGEGVAADWQPSTCTLIQPGQWLHVVGEYTLNPADTPSACNPAYPGTINIWVNGVKWNQIYHGQTGCWDQPGVATVVPQPTASWLSIGTVDQQTWFPGAIAKVAIYNKPLTDEPIAKHYQSMTGAQPTSTICANAYCTL